MVLCGKCDDRIVEEDLLSCNGICKGNYHHICVGINIGVFRKMTIEKRKIWKCLGCRNPDRINENVLEALPARTNKNNAEKTFGKTTETLPTNFSEEDTTNHLLPIDNLNISSLNELYGYIKKDLTDTEKRHDNEIHKLMRLVDEIKLENRDFKKDIKQLNIHLNKTLEENKELKMENKKLSEQIELIKGELDEVSQYSRLNNIIVTGLPEERDENLNNVMKNLARSINQEFDPSEILTVHRLGKTRGRDGCRDIIVQFKNREIKRMWYKKSRIGPIRSESISTNLRGSRIYLNEHLTKNNKHLFYQARQLKKEQNYKFLWTNDAKILIRKDENTKIERIRNQSDIDRLNGTD